MKTTVSIAIMFLAGMASVAVVSGCRGTRDAMYHTAGYSPEYLRWAEEHGDSEARCYIGWSFYMAGNYEQAVKWLENPNTNATGVAGKLFIEGLGTPRDIKRGIEYYTMGAEFPDIGGNEMCASELADMYEYGILVPRDGEKAYYFLGLCIAKCSGSEDDLIQRPILVARQRRIGSRLSAEKKKIQDERLRKWLDDLKAPLCIMCLGELDEDVQAVSVYVSEDTSVNVTIANSEKLSGYNGVPIVQLGKRLKALNVMDNATIRVYLSEPSAKSEAIIRGVLADPACKYPNVLFPKGRVAEGNRQTKE